ncbi:AraC family transcriptional regulator [Ekhidna sp.]|uniref:AraC family transcriptional regulator n=1 Tax=Ekhidna sp. TaxID=2608089 RepID=UPI003CCBB58A
MHFERFEPSDTLKTLVKEYWIYEDENSTPVEQKIIPDGFSEIIIHYGDAYLINLHGEWELQSGILFSSQISKYFFLKNSGSSKMLGIKLYPSAFYSLFQQNMSATVDKVLPLEQILSQDLYELHEIKRNDSGPNKKISVAEEWLIKQLPLHKQQIKIDQCIATILEKKGMIEIEHLADTLGLSTRQLERLFKKVIGVTPKFYCRIIRFNYIFEVMKDHKDSWIRTALQSGYFDQSHFIKNFKEFTGEEPSNYGFNEKNLANSFLKK